MFDLTFTLSHEGIALMLFASMGMLMLTGQRVFAAHGTPLNLISTITLHGLLPWLRSKLSWALEYF